MLKKNKQFSLIELLLVMVISAIMLGIVIPTFHKLTKGVNVEMAARQFGSQLKAVREYAITNRVYVALIMEPINGTSFLPVGYRLLAYRPCIVNSSNVFQEWVEGERWEFLPDRSMIFQNKIKRFFEFISRRTSIFYNFSQTFHICFSF